MGLSFIHSRLAITAIIYTTIMAVWGLWRFFRRQGLESSYWGALAINEGLILLQGILGLILYFNPAVILARGVHILYGVVSVITLPFAFTFTRGRSERQEMSIYSLALVFLVLILLRAYTTGG
jgi:uncharacterized membrane protein SirB2